MKIYTKNEIINDDLFDVSECENVTVVNVVSGILAKYFLSKSDEIDAMDEDEVGFQMSIDGNEINFVYMEEIELSNNEINFFLDDLMCLFEGCDFEEFCDEIDEMSNKIVEDIKHMEWFVKKYVHRRELDLIEDMYFDEAKQEYAFENDISKDDIDSIEDSDVVDFIYEADFAYVAETFIYDKSNPDKWVEKKMLELW